MTWGTQAETGLNRERSPALAPLRERERKGGLEEKEGVRWGAGRGQSACILVGREPVAECGEYSSVSRMLALHAHDPGLHLQRCINWAWWWMSVVLALGRWSRRPEVQSHQ